MILNWKTTAALFATVALTACSGAENPENDNDGNNAANTATNNDGTNNGSNAGNSDVDYSGLVINEIVASGDPDWFELYNSGGDDVDLTGVTFTDDLADPAQGAFEAGATVPAGGYMSFDVADEGVGFKLSGDEELGVFAPDGTEIDSVDWDEGDSPDGKSFGRFPNGSGEFKILAMPTRDAENVDNEEGGPECGDDTIEGEEICDGTDLGGQTCADEGFVGGDLACNAECDGYDTSACEAAMGDVVINEVTAKDDDNIELFNTGDAPMSLDGWYIVDDGWDSANPDPEHKYDFPAGTELAMGEYLELVKDTDHVFGVGGDDTITLYDADDVVVDETTWPDGDADTSWCRIPNGSGDFQVCTTRTFGAENMSD